MPGGLGVHAVAGRHDHLCCWKPAPMPVGDVSHLAAHQRPALAVAAALAGRHLRQSCRSNDGAKYVWAFRI